MHQTATRVATYHVEIHSCMYLEDKRTTAVTTTGTTVTCQASKVPDFTRVQGAKACGSRDADGCHFSLVSVAGIRVMVVMVVMAGRLPPFGHA